LSAKKKVGRSGRRMHAHYATHEIPNTGNAQFIQNPPMCLDVDYETYTKKNPFTRGYHISLSGRGVFVVEQ
jgi:hypothetical protein